MPNTHATDTELSVIPVNEPLLNDRAREYVNECVSSGWISSEGRFIAAFENSWANYCGMPYGVAVSNGTTALELAVRCLDLEPGDEVIIPTFTIISCALAVLRAGLKPVLVDSDPRTWCLDVGQVRAKNNLSNKGNNASPHVRTPGRHGSDSDLAQKNSLFVIEDAAESHGAKYKSKTVGGIGDLSGFSFYANKIITTGEGGMVLARNQQHADKLRSLRNLCFRPERRFFHTELGHNYRLTNLQAAVGLSQVEAIDEHIRRKRWLGKDYTEQLSEVAEITLPVEEEWAMNVYWMYGIVLNDDVKFDAVELAGQLRKKGVDTRPFFLGMHEQPILLEQGLFGSEKYPVAERLARRGLYLPSGLTLTKDQLDRVCVAVKEVFA